MNSTDKMIVENPLSFFWRASDEAPQKIEEAQPKQMAAYLWRHRVWMALIIREPGRDHLVFLMDEDEIAHICVRYWGTDCEPIHTHEGAELYPLIGEDLERRWNISLREGH